MSSALRRSRGPQSRRDVFTVAESVRYIRKKMSELTLRTDNHVERKVGVLLHVI